MAAAVFPGLRKWSDPGFCRMHDPIPSLETIPANDDAGRWPVRRDDVYVHPLVLGAPSLRLSQKSLELCTENLGNETGSDNESAVPGVFSLSMAEKEECPPKPLHGRAKKAEKYAGFPPPLSTMKGTADLQYKMRREQGRLVLEAVRTSSTNAVFRAERTQGKLTLSYVDEPARISPHYKEDDQEYHDTKGREETEGDEDNVEAVEGCTFNRLGGCKDSDHPEREQGIVELGNILGCQFLGKPHDCLLSFLLPISGDYPRRRLTS